MDEEVELSWIFVVGFILFFVFVGTNLSVFEGTHFSSNLSFCYNYLYISLQCIYKLFFILHKTRDSS